MFYRYISRNGDNITYRVTLKLFRICGSGTNIAELPDRVYFTIFNKATNTRFDAPTVERATKETQYLGAVDPCIVNPPNICFQIGTYVRDITVPITAAGYVVSFQSCCRDNSMQNIIDTRVPSNEQQFPGNGATYFTELPGSDDILTNSGPYFAKDEAVLVCANKKFTYDFSAKDPDADSLVYSFCDAYGGGYTTDGSGVPRPSDAPPYNFIPYKSPFAGTAPLGIQAVIDPKTGVISGIAPNAGKYVVTVCASEYRNGRLLSIHRKDFHINVTTCVREVVAAMPEKYNDCSGYTVTFLNNSTEGKTYDWDFGDGQTLTTQSTDPLPHTYAQDGTYTVKLWVDKNSNCGDSATATAYVYPMLRPDPRISGFCSNTTTVFTDHSTTSSTTDAINYYRWDFGDGSSVADTSNQKNATYQYPGPGNYEVVLQIKTAQGCERADTSHIIIYDRPPLTTTEDTLLCIRNSIQLRAESSVDGNVVNGSYTWTPAYNITNANTATPTIFPKVDTTYTVTFTDATGCSNTSQVAIDVRDTLIIRTIADSTICTGDEVHIRAFPDGEYPLTWYNMADNSTVGTGTVLSIVPPAPAVNYLVRGELGGCDGYDDVKLTVVDPPVAYAGEDTTICYGEQVVLRATGGSSYQWTPANTLTSPISANTVARPTDTTRYIVTVTDVLGCPKPIYDTVQINVVPPVQAFAGNDTIVMLNQPFQLNASGGTSYIWTPVDGLDNPNIYNPTTNINRDYTYTVAVYTDEGCMGTDAIRIRFITGPDIYVPSGFSPNGDGQNDIFRPLPVGIVEMDFFRVYDRWGKLMYSTSKYLQGWDGYFNGAPAAVGTYVWVVQGKNIDNETVIRKGTVTLVR
ncbi:gliding motility-associated C-terminal domain-containing protein [Chitinophaga rhizophila]|uniref:Gliding motility-associated C-terminal domain-containing protein n=1 Tax=Chitinophaga rhizophila TaxID=2866212 RepID=A0ABS7GCP1_9BACT|nr:gliding motility-associated C-terminal domain-containing protein [Chitinophaga rhizophila]MBW8685443.1 gliding motility-associated C-terminal domain-containing protein [Chitinophaga rhizophila]